MKRFIGDRRLRWFRFYPTEYVADFQLMSCSLAAQGLWMRLICLMTQSERYGVLAMHGHPLVATDLARLFHARPRTVKHLMAELEQQQVYSIDADGFIFCRRMVREWAQDQADRSHGKQGGNSALIAPEPEPPPPSPTKPRASANDDKAASPHTKKRELVSNSSRTRRELDSNSTPTRSELVSNSSPTRIQRVSRERSESSDSSALLEIRVNPTIARTVKAERETETEREKETEEERNSAARFGTVARDVPAMPVCASDPASPSDNVIELRAGRADGLEEALSGEIIPPTAPRSPGGEQTPPLSRRNRGERTPPTGTEAMLADEGRALASWNTLAAATGMVLGTMNALTRRRIRTILAIGGGLQGWDTALAAAETAPLWNGTGTSDWRPTIGSFCKPDLFAKLIAGAYAPRDRRASDRPRSASDQAAVEAMERIMGMDVGDVA